MGHQNGGGELIWHDRAHGAAEAVRLEDVVNGAAHQSASRDIDVFRLGVRREREAPAPRMRPTNENDAVVLDEFSRPNLRTENPLDSDIKIDTSFA